MAHDEDFYSEYNDPDATACALGDYNTWEEEQVFLDGYGDFGYDEEAIREEEYFGYDDYDYDRHDYFED